MDRVPQSYCWLAGFSIGFTVAVALTAQTSQIKFTPPTRSQQIAAIGPLQGLLPVLRRALDPANDFAPIPKPGDIDWLENFAEPGQTYSQFVQSQPRRPNARRNKLYLQPIGKYDESAGASLALLRQFTSSFFMMEVAVLPPLDVSQSHIKTRTNFYTHRPQMLTGDILKLLYGRLPPDAFALLGITMTDLYPGPGWNYLFGQAAPRSAVGVYSFARYDPAFYGQARTPASRQLLLRRSCKVLAHEVSHMFGIEHCIWFRCTVNGCNHIGELDGAPLHLCPVDLRKLQWSAGFDVLERYRRLRDFCTQTGLRDEAEWLEKRLRFILAEPPDRRP
jgi:archaemetzincin